MKFIKKKSTVVNWDHTFLTENYVGGLDVDLSAKTDKELAEMIVADISENFSIDVPVGVVLDGGFIATTQYAGEDVPRIAVKCDTPLLATVTSEWHVSTETVYSVIDIPDVRARYVPAVSPGCAALENQIVSALPYSSYKDARQHAEDFIDANREKLLGCGVPDPEPFVYIADEKTLADSWLSKAMERAGVDVWTEFIAYRKANGFDPQQEDEPEDEPENVGAESTQVYYYTYGSSKQFPFQFGWTEVEAPNATIADALFRAYHPDRTPGVLNCAFVYTHEEFWKSINPTVKRPGNVCHERISVKRTLQ